MLVPCAFLIRKYHGLLYVILNVTKRLSAPDEVWVFLKMSPTR
jgi:hypothetical protein